MKVTQTVCDICSSPVTDSKSYTISHMGKRVVADLCWEHSVELDALMEKVIEKQGLVRPPVRRRKHTQVRASSMEEIEALKSK